MKVYLYIYIKHKLLLHHPPLRHSLNGRKINYKYELLEENGIKNKRALAVSNKINCDPCFGEFECQGG